MIKKEFSSNDFFPGMKVFLDGEFGVVIDQYEEWNGVFIINGHECKGTPTKLYGIIRWDTISEHDSEDWVGLYGSFIDAGGSKVDIGYNFIYINNNGSLK